jgi:hypothetical protein
VPSQCLTNTFLSNTSLGNIQVLLMCSKPRPPLPSLTALRGSFMLGSLSHVVQHPVRGYFGLAPHPTVPSNPNVREPRIKVHKADKGEHEARRLHFI